MQGSSSAPAAGKRVPCTKSPSRALGCGGGGSTSTSRSFGLAAGSLHLPLNMRGKSLTQKKVRTFILQRAKKVSKMTMAPPCWQPAAASQLTRAPRSRAASPPGAGPSTACAEQGGVRRHAADDSSRRRRVGLALYRGSGSTIRAEERSLSLLGSSGSAPSSGSARTAADPTPRDHRHFPRRPHPVTR